MTAAARAATPATFAAAMFATILAMLLAACRSTPPPPPPPPKPVTAVVTIVSAADLNPNHSGRASPVFLRLFQLKDGAKFLNASFDDVTMRSDQVLAAALVSREERMVEPGSTVTVNLEVPPEARLLGVVAEYSDLANSQWRAASPPTEGGLLTLFRDHSLLVTVGRQSVSVATAPPKGAPPKNVPGKGAPSAIAQPAGAAPPAIAPPAPPAVAPPATPAVAPPSIALPKGT